MFIPDRELMPIIRAALERGQRVRMTVNGRSMLPFIRDGDVVEIAPMPPTPTLGSVVLARLSGERYPLHRLVAQCGAAWLLRGDNCGVPDGMVPCENLVGVVTRVERNGRVVRLASVVPGNGSVGSVSVVGLRRSRGGLVFLGVRPERFCGDCIGCLCFGPG